MMALTLTPCLDVEAARAEASVQAGACALLREHNIRLERELAEAKALLERVPPLPPSGLAELIRRERAIARSSESRVENLQRELQGLIEENKQAWLTIETLRASLDSLRGMLTR